jgi:hypothetical protein
MVTNLVDAKTCDERFCFVLLLAAHSSGINPDGVKGGYGPRSCHPQSYSQFSMLGGEILV